MSRDILEKKCESVLLESGDKLQKWSRAEKYNWLHGALDLKKKRFRTAALNNTHTKCQDVINVILLCTSLVVCRHRFLN